MPPDDEEHLYRQLRRAEAEGRRTILLLAPAVLIPGEIVEVRPGLEAIAVAQTPPKSWWWTADRCSVVAVAAQDLRGYLAQVFLDSGTPLKAAR